VFDDNAPRAVPSATSTTSSSTGASEFINLQFASQSIGQVTASPSTAPSNAAVTSLVFDDNAPQPESVSTSASSFETVASTSVNSPSSFQSSTTFSDSGIASGTSSFSDAAAASASAHFYEAQPDNVFNDLLLVEGLLGDELAQELEEEEEKKKIDGVFELDVERERERRRGLTRNRPTATEKENAEEEKPEENIDEEEKPLTTSSFELPVENKKPSRFVRAIEWIENLIIPKAHAEDQTAALIAALSAAVAGPAAAIAQVGSEAARAGADRDISAINANASVAMTQIQANTTALLSNNQTEIGLGKTAATERIAALQQDGATERLMLQLESMKAERESFAEERAEIREIEQDRADQQIAFAREQAAQNLELARMSLDLQLVQAGLSTGLNTTNTGSSLRVTRAFAGGAATAIQPALSSPITTSAPSTVNISTGTPATFRAVQSGPLTVGDVIQNSASTRLVASLQPQITLRSPGLGITNSLRLRGFAQVQIPRLGFRHILADQRYRAVTASTRQALQARAAAQPRSFTGARNLTPHRATAQRSVVGVSYPGGTRSH